MGALYIEQKLFRPFFLFVRVLLGVGQSGYPTYTKVLSAPSQVAEA